MSTKQKVMARCLPESTDNFSQYIPAAPLFFAKLQHGSAIQNPVGNTVSKHLIMD